MSESLVDEPNWAADAGSITAADLEALARIVAAVRAETLSIDELSKASDGFPMLFARALLADEAGAALIHASLDELASNRAWISLAAAARLAGGEEPESEYAPALLRAHSQLGHGEELAQLGSRMAAIEPKRVPGRYRLAVARAMADRAYDPGSSRTLLHAAIEYVGSHGTDTEIEQLFDLLAAEIGAADVPPLVDFCERLARRQVDGEAYVELIAMAFAESEQHLELWNFVRELTLRTGQLSTSSADLAAAALQALFGDAARTPATALRGADPAGEWVAAMQRIARAVDWRPGTFVRTGRNDYLRVVDCDGVQITLENAAGRSSVVPLDPALHQRVDAQSWPVRVAFGRDQLRNRTLQEPLAALEDYVRSHSGPLTDLGLRAELTSQRLLRPEEWEDWFDKIKDAIRRGEGGVTYDGRSRALALGTPRAGARRSRSAAAKKPAPKRHILPLPEEQRKRPPAADENLMVLNIADIPAAKAMLQRLKEEVESLDRELRFEIPEKLETAAAHGDLRENAEYDAAKQRKVHVENLLLQMIPRVQSVAAIDGIRCLPDQVALLRSVRIVELPAEAVKVVHLVPNELADPQRRFVSIGSPLGRALNRRRVGETVEFELPSGKRKVRICAVGIFGEAPESG